MSLLVQNQDIRQTLNGEREVAGSRSTLYEAITVLPNGNGTSPNPSSAYNELDRVSFEIGGSANPVYHPLSVIQRTSPELFESNPRHGELDQVPCDELAPVSSGMEMSACPTPDPQKATMTPKEGTEAEGQKKDESAKHWKLWCLVAVVIALAISLPVGWALRVQDFTVNSPNEAAMLQLYGNLVSIDPVAQIMTLDWDIRANCGVNFTITCVDDDIYFDQSLLQNPQGNTAPFPNNGQPTPTFRFVAASLNNQTVGFYANSLFFRTQVVTYSREVGFKERTLQAYPFDTYGAQIFISTNQTSLEIVQVNGISPGFSVTIDPSRSFNDPAFLGVELTLDISRGAVVRLYTISILIAIWLVTLTLLASTVSIVILGRKMAKEVLAVPVGTLFAFTSLRGTLPGAPAGFGAIIDFMAVLPCLAILTFCAVFMLGVFVFDRDPHLSRRPLWHGPMVRARKALNVKSS